MTSNKEKLTILLVDDDVDFLEQQKIFLEGEGFTVIEAESREEAERIISGEKPDLAILDLMMDQMDDGFVLSYNIKKQYPDVPVIIVSGVTSETGIEFEEPSGADSWIKADVLLSKPIRFEQLRREIERLCRTIQK